MFLAACLTKDHGETRSEIQDASPQHLHKAFCHHSLWIWMWLSDVMALSTAALSPRASWTTTTAGW